jgi:steroid delta-isomerase-like uncharacterized protein
MSNVDTFRAAHEAFNRRDWAAVMEAFAQDAEYVDRARDVTLKGPQEFTDYLRESWVAAFSDAQVTRATYSDAGGTVVAQFIGTGTNDGAMDTLPATGRSMRTPFCEILTFNQAGQIVAGQLYYDRMSMLGQLGHILSPEVDKRAADEEAIRRVVQLCLEGEATGNVDKLREAFHDDARMFGSLAGERYDVPISELFDLAASAPADTGSYRARILAVRQTEDAAFATVEEEGYWGTVSFTDYLSLARIDGTWKIINKLFAHTGGEPPEMT